MLIKKEYTKTDNGTLYKCDRCNREMNKNYRVGIFIKLPKDSAPHIKWDLCSKCYNALVRGIEKK